GDGRQVGLAAGGVDVAVQLGPLADQTQAGAGQGAQGPPLFGIGVGQREVAAPEQGGGGLGGGGGGAGGWGAGGASAPRAGAWRRAKVMPWSRQVSASQYQQCMHSQPTTRPSRKGSTALRKGSGAAARLRARRGCPSRSRTARKRDLAWRSTPA